MEKLIVANMSGFYGDRLSAAKEMVEGGPIDFLTGDYLAELTMAILYKAQAKKPDLGYARTFLRQMEEIMGTCLDNNIKVVVNAGGLNPAGLADALTAQAETLGLHPKIAYIQGDNLMPRLGELQQKGETFAHVDKGISLAEGKMPPVSANAYLGCWGIVEALKEEAHIVVTGRVADTSVVMGPAAYHFGWEKDNWDALAGAAAAGHIIECSGQATGGNYSYFKEVPSYHKVGFPIAELYEDGSSVITKHPGTGGLVSVGTVTAQLMYEINAPAYITPDVVAHFDTIQLEQEAKDRVKVSGTRGTPATNSAKVTINCLGGFKNVMSFHIAGLDIAQKAHIFTDTFLKSIGGKEAFDELYIDFFDNHQDNPKSNGEAFSTLRISVIDSDSRKAGKFFTSKLVELSLSTIPGLCFNSVPGPALPRIVHFPALVDKKYLQQEVFVNGKKILVEEVSYHGEEQSVYKVGLPFMFSFEGQEMEERYLGELYAARSGDKGGNANLGIWGKTAQAHAFLKAFLTVEKFKELLPETAEYEITRYDFPNVFGLNFYIVGLLREGVAASTRIDGQAKTLGEYLRAKRVQVPKSLLAES